MFTTYVLENNKGKRYTGSISDIFQRLSMHNDTNPSRAKFHKTTYKKGPWTIIFQKNFSTRKGALDFEKFLKSGRGREWLKISLL